MNIQKNTPTVWVLLDDRAGNINQAVGVAEALNFPYVLKNIRYDGMVKLPNLLRGRTLLGVDLKNSDHLRGPWPHIVVAAGRRLAPVARFIKRKAGGNCLLVQLMWPGYPTGDFDIIAVPTHDGIHFRPRLVHTLGAPNRITPATLVQAQAMWEKTLLQKAPRGPYIALLVGGDTKKGPFTAAHARELAKLASEFANAKNSALLITVSRRTSDAVINVLRASLTCPYYFHDPAKERANPYVAFLAMSTGIIVTGDSISMCSESCSSGKPVYIYSKPDFVPRKHRQLHQHLYEAGYAAPFSPETYTQCNHLKVPSEPLQEAQDVARRVRELYLNLA